MPDAQRVVVLGAAGVVGSWVARDLVAPQDDLTLVDILVDTLVHPEAGTEAGTGAGTGTGTGTGAGVARPGRTTSLTADARIPSAGLAEAVGRADTVVLALSEGAVLACLPWVLDRMPSGAVLVTTCSVQAPVFGRLRALDATRDALGVNPLFSPVLNPRGRAVALAADAATTPGLVDEVTRRLTPLGADVVTVDPEVHDEMLGYLQVLPHAALLSTVMALASSPFDPGTLVRLAPPPARLLLDLACRLLTSNPEVYRDIQSGGPAAERRRDLASALTALDRLVRDGSAEDFDAALAGLLEWAGDAGPRLAAECADLLAAWPPAPPGHRAEAVSRSSGVGQGHRRP